MPASRPTVAVLSLALVALLGGVLLSPAPVASRSSGANPGFAGDQKRTDGSVVTCNVCHGSFELDAGPGTVAIDAPAATAPGERVAITVSLDAAALLPGGRQGFEAIVRDPETGDLWGTLHLTDAVETRYAGEDDERYVTHTTSGTARDAWTFEWAPGEARTGTARVYVAANAANNDGLTGGDYVYTATADVAVSGTSARPGPEAAFAVGTPRPHPVRVGQGSTVDVTLDTPGRLRIRLVDASGRTVREVADGDRPVGAAPVRVETAGLAAGVYAVVVDGPGGVRTRPLVVIR